MRGAGEVRDWRGGEARWRLAPLLLLGGLGGLTGLLWRRLARGLLPCLGGLLGGGLLGRFGRFLGGGLLPRLTGLLCFGRRLLDRLGYRRLLGGGLLGSDGLFGGGLLGSD